jgi:hypothetical protein
MRLSLFGPHLIGVVMGAVDGGIAQPGSGPTTGTRPTALTTRGAGRFGDDAPGGCGTLRQVAP